MTKRGRWWAIIGTLAVTIPLTMGGCDDHCGNGKLQTDKGEQCDDKNLRSGDGCSATCQTEGPTVCVTTTATEFSTAANADAEAKRVLEIAAGLRFGTTGTNVLKASKCNEGGTTPWSWVVHLKTTWNNQPDGVLTWITDGKPGMRVAFSHADKAKTKVWMEYRDYTLLLTATGLDTMIARDGTQILPPPVGALEAAASAVKKKQQAAVPEQLPIPPSVTPDAAGYPSPAFIEGIARVVSWLGPRAAFAQTPGYSLNCDAKADAWGQKAGKWVDELPGNLGNLMLDLVECMTNPTSCSPSGVRGGVRDITDFGGAEPYVGTACTTLDCEKGKCIASYDGAPWSPELSSVCVADGTGTDCNSSCNEQCDTTTGDCRGIKILAITEAPIAEDSRVWRCGENDGDEFFTGWQCPDGGDPAWTDENGYFKIDHTYKPRMVFNWCGRPSKTQATFITPFCGGCSNGWVCNQGTSWIGSNPPNPFIFDPAWTCCSGGGAPLPSSCTLTMKVATGGVQDNVPFQASCVAQPTSERLCDCSSPDDFTDPIDSPVEGYDSGGGGCPNGS